jgi:hypothetical protein
VSALSIGAARMRDISESPLVKKILWSDLEMVRKFCIPPFAMIQAPVHTSHSILPIHISIISLRDSYFIPEA